MANNWYSKTKIADLMEQPGAEMVSDKYDKLMMQDQIKRGPGAAQPPYHKGMRVKDRRKGLANRQEYGIVRSVDENQVVIEWFGAGSQKGTKQPYSLDDTIALSAIVAEA